MACILCATDSFSEIGEKRGFTIVKCAGCGFVYTMPLPREEELIKATQKRNKSKKSKEIEEGKEKQKKIIKALKSIGDTMYKNQGKFEAVLDNALKKHDIDVDKSLKKAILKALSEHDETADIIYDKNSNPEPDTDLRDYENVPLKEDIHEYFKREVKPHLPDAWIDEKKTKVGYEISFTKYFYKYKPLRPLNEITSDIKTLEGETGRLMEEIFER